ncbi:hypothetical protein VTJ04DRAFT_6082 [Mycothermus thermophilus]|uniref:uncharacterized protein n=1 Tax=Humicola insolens TaxID=85995 RepID=UPI003742BE08
MTTTKSNKTTKLDPLLCFLFWIWTSSKQAKQHNRRLGKGVGDGIYFSTIYPRSLSLPAQCEEAAFSCFHIVRCASKSRGLNIGLASTRCHPYSPSLERSLSVLSLRYTQHTTISRAVPGAPRASSLFLVRLSGIDMLRDTMAALVPVDECDVPAVEQPNDRNITALPRRMNEVSTSGGARRGMTASVVPGACSANIVILRPP